MALTADLAVTARGHDAAARDRDGRRARTGRIERDDTPVEQNDVGRYCAHPLSRCARPSEWSGMSAHGAFRLRPPVTSRSGQALHTTWQPRLTRARSEEHTSA